MVLIISKKKDESDSSDTSHYENEDESNLRVIRVNKNPIGSVLVFQYVEACGSLRLRFGGFGLGEGRGVTRGILCASFKWSSYVLARVWRAQCRTNSRTLGRGYGHFK